MAQNLRLTVAATSIAAGVGLGEVRFSGVLARGLGRSGLIVFAAGDGKREGAGKGGKMHGFTEFAARMQPGAVVHRGFLLSAIP